MTDDEIRDIALKIAGLYKDKEILYDITSFRLAVKHSSKLDFHINGEFTNLAMGAAFNKDDENHKAAIEGIKNTLWYCFKKCYLGEE